MKYICFLLFLFPFRLSAQTTDTTAEKANGYIDSLGRKQGVFIEKQQIEGYKDSVTCGMNYVDGKLSGSFTCPLTNGKRHIYGVYTAGEKDKVWVLPDTTGFNNRTIYYREGRIRKKLYEIYKEQPDGTAQVEKITYRYGNGTKFKTEYYQLNEKGQNVLVKTRSSLAWKGPGDPFRTFNLNGPWAVTGGYTYQYNHWMELGVRKYSRVEFNDPMDVVQATSYVFAGAEMRYFKYLQVAPKIGAGHHFNETLIDLNLNLILYNERFQRFNPAITPEIGLCLGLEFLEVNYGYNIFLGNEKFLLNQNHRISVRITIPFFSTGKQS